MVPSPLQMRRSHNILLLQKLLNLRDGASPFTLLIDSLEQPAAIVTGEFAKRAKLVQSRIVCVAFASLPNDVVYPYDAFVKARKKTLSELSSEINLLIDEYPERKTLLIIDTLNPLTNPHHHPYISLFLTSLLTRPHVSLVATYHEDLPLSTPALAPSSIENAHLPSPLTTLTYLATAVLRISNLDHDIAQRRAISRSQHPPVFGLQERKEGLVISARQPRRKMGSASPTEAVVLEMEMRRRSGRGVREAFVLEGWTSSDTAAVSSTTEPTTTTPTTTTSSILKPAIRTTVSSPSPASTSTQTKILLLDDHPAIQVLSMPADRAGDDAATTTASTSSPTADDPADARSAGLTFKLGLTAKEKRDREAVVLPYFEAQGREGRGRGSGGGGGGTDGTDGSRGGGGGGMSRAPGAGEGGRILYEMGREDWDDFDEEEDEI